MTARDKWIKQPLEGDVPSLMDTDLKPTNCRMLINCLCVTSSFSTMAEYPINMTLAEAIEEDRVTNLEHFGIEQPGIALKELDYQFEADTVNRKAVQTGINVLIVIMRDCLELAAEFDETTPESQPYFREELAENKQVAKALAQAIRIATELIK